MIKKEKAISIIAALILITLLTGSKCTYSDGDNIKIPVEITITPTEETQTPEETIQTKETGDSKYSSSMTEDEKDEFYKELEDMSADEFNQIIGEELENLPEETGAELLDCLKEYYLVYDGCSSSNWQLPTDFNAPKSLQWPESIPKPSQGSVAKVEQGKEVSRVQIKNITKKTYEEWKSKFDDQWSFGCAVLEAANEKFDKAEEYVENNTKDSIGPNSKTTSEIYIEESREKTDSVIFTDEDSGKWLELSYGQNMATIAYTNDFTASGTDNENSEKTDIQKANEAVIDKVCTLSIPAPKDEKLTKYTPDGKTENGNIGQVLQFEGGNVDSTNEWVLKLVADGWDMKMGVNEDFIETKMYDIDGTDDFIPDTLGVTAEMSNTYFEKQIDNTVYRMKVTIVETAYGLGDEVDTKSENYKRWVIVTINGIDVVDLVSAEQ